MAFVDILGWKEAQRGITGETVPNQVVAAVRELQQQPQLAELMKRLPFDHPRESRCTWLSDSLVWSAPLEAQSLFSLVTMIQGVAWNLLFGPGFLVRGHLTVGSIHHEGEVVLGPGVASAAEEGSRSGSPPRVTVSGEVCGELRAVLSPTQFAALVRSDPLDGQGHVHFLARLDAMGELPEYRDSIRSILESSLHDRSPLLREKLRGSSPSPSHRSKWHWTARYANERLLQLGSTRLIEPRDETASMPELSRFFGISIRMYYNDHAPPHFHVEYAEYTAVVEVETLDVVRGGLPRRALGLVLEWAALQRQELRVDWTLAQAGKQPRPIEPLE